MNIIIISTVLLISKITCFRSLCPSPEDINPCKCISNSIQCHNIWKNFDLENISTKLDSKKSNTTFAEFTLYNTTITKIGNIFKSVAFNHISISDNKNLTYISANAFSGSEATLPIFDVEGNVRLSNPPPNERNIFDASTQFVNVKYILLPHNGLTSIPDHAFHSNHSDLHQLTYLNLRQNNITRIPTEAISNLAKLSSINLGQNKINSIAKSAFVLSANITSALISIDYNQLNSSSFEGNWFSLKELNSSAKVDINLSNNNITYLDQHIFEELLSPKYNIVLTVDSNPFKCDCKSKWLIINKKLLKSKVRGIKCEDKTDLWLKTDKDFTGCT